MSRIKVKQLTVNTVDNIIRFENVEITIDNSDVALIVFEDNNTVTAFPLCNVVYISYCARE